ncbi:MAG: CheR family methyltransferase [Thermodesulfovibrionales bacterium]
MFQSVSKVDALRHVRFVGRPAITVPRLSERTKSLSPRARHAPAHQSERPDPFISWVFQRAGLSVESYRGEALQRRLSACLRALHADTKMHARQMLEQRPDLLPTAIGALLIGVTEFFRDPSVFEALRTEILPELASPRQPLRVWSAGCSNGAELYSLAILLEQVGLLEGSFLLGSDCRLVAIEHARAALYNSGELQKIEPSDRRTYFNEAGSFWQPMEPLRRHVHWKVADLSRGIEEGPWDMILWRNMAIYLKAEVASSLWRGLASALAPEGVLMVGRAERPPMEVPLSSVRRCIYRACSREGGRTFGLQPDWTSHSYPRTPETLI